VAVRPHGGLPLFESSGYVPSDRGVGARS
jgi:hypothetical protein